MELALQVVGLKMTGKVEDAKDIAMRIVGSSQDSHGNTHAGNTSQMMNLASNALPDSRRLILGRESDDDFEKTIMDSLSSLDMRGVSNLTDYMIVCSGTSMPQLRAILRDVSGRIAEEHGVKPVNSEGKADTRWVVLDYIDVMVHVMHDELREYYGLEDLWKDAKEVSWQAAEGA